MPRRRADAAVTKRMPFDAMGARRVGAENEIQCRLVEADLKLRTSPSIICVCCKIVRIVPTLFSDFFQISPRILLAVATCTDGQEEEERVLSHKRKRLNSLVPSATTAFRTKRSMDGAEAAEACGPFTAQFKQFALELDATVSGAAAAFMLLPSAFYYYYAPSLLLRAF